MRWHINAQHLQPTPTHGHHNTAFDAHPTHCACEQSWQVHACDLYCHCTASWVSLHQPLGLSTCIPVLVCRDEDLSRKRPYDGLAPNNRQEAAAAAAGVQPSGMNMPMKGGPMHMQMRPAGQAAPGMRPGQPQMPMGRGMGAGGLTGAQQQQALIQLAMASVQHLPPAQQQAALQAQLQAMQRNAQIARAQGVAGGIPGQPQVGAGMQGLNQGLPAGQQLQNLQGLRAPGLPPQVLAAQQQQQQQQQALHQHLMQQQAIQQQQLRMQQGLPAGLPAGMPANLQLLQQQQGVVQQGVVQQRIPQGDGSSDLPCSISEVAAAAGMQPDQLRAMMPRRIAAILDRSAGASSSSMRVPAAAAGQAAGAADVALLPPAAADTQGAVASSVSGGGGAAAGRVKPRRRRHGPSIPQVDGNGDDEEEEEEEFGGDYEGKRVCGCVSRSCMAKHLCTC